MIKYHDRLLPDVGKCFIVNKMPKLSIEEGTKFKEVKINHKFTQINDNTYILDNKFEIRVDKSLKKRLINMLFSNDDQISIILNYQQEPDEENTTIFNHMQEWRKWFSDIITECNAKECSTKSINKS